VHQNAIVHSFESWLPINLTSLLSASLRLLSVNADIGFGAPGPVHAEGAMALEFLYERPPSLLVRPCDYLNYKSVIVLPMHLECTQKLCDMKPTT
jgi:hypothetical protein